jgi:hypothetical protein
MVKTTERTVFWDMMPRVWKRLTDVSEERTGSIFRIEE